jgi:uncharacterized protein (DUF302 family)
MIMARLLMAVITITALLAAPFSFAADEKIGIFETIHESSVSYEETVSALDAAIASSGMRLHGSHDVRVPDDVQKARVYVLTSPRYIDAAASERARTISAQVLRLAVYTLGEEQRTYINMTNPVAHAMVFYAGSDSHDALLAAAKDAAAEVRQIVSEVPGKALGVQAEPMRTAKHLAKYKGDGPARMMAKFRTWESSQLQILEDSADNFDAVLERVVKALAAGQVGDATDASGWQVVTTIRVRDDAVYIGLSNPFIEDKMVRINSRFRADNKSETAPYPGVDHVAALPTEVLVIREGDKTRVLHYGQMWRMQLYFWDSGYRAFTANVGVPSAIANSIEDAVNSAE